MQDELWQAIVSCDKRYDGQFFYGVLTPGIFCRPSCKSRIPKREHVRIFLTTSDARAAGLRACKRCRPEVNNWHGSDKELVALARNLMESSFHQPLTLHEMSIKLHVSSYYFHRIFKRMTGITPAQYLVNCRVEAAKALLIETEANVKEIALKVGFKTIAHFSSVFRQETGLSPTEFRCRSTSYFK